jgi:hypothetical protein
LEEVWAQDGKHLPLHRGRHQPEHGLHFGDYVRDSCLCIESAVVSCNDCYDFFAANARPPALVAAHRIFVMFSVYVLLGMLYNRFVMGKTGMEQMPNLEFWEGCCGHVKVGHATQLVFEVGCPRTRLNADPRTVSLLLDMDRVASSFWARALGAAAGRRSPTR